MKKSSRTLLISALCLALSGCSNQIQDSPKQEREQKPILEGKCGASYYCGMPNKDTFPMSEPYFRGAVNVFYPADATNILWRGKNYEVLEVTPERIKLREIRDNKR